MIKFTLSKPLTRSVRYASILAHLPHTPGTIPRQPHHDTSFIVTLASDPMTTPSNNAFHPAHIPTKAKAKLVLSELEQVLEASKKLLDQLEQYYIHLDSGLQPTKVTPSGVKLRYPLDRNHHRKYHGQNDDD